MRRHETVRFPKRGRSSGSGLLVLGTLLLGAAACEPPVPGPVADPAGTATQRIRTADGLRVVHNDGPREILRVYPEPPPGNARLVFMEGRGSTPLPDGGVAWPDLESDRILILDDGGEIRRILQGAPEDGPPLTRPAFAAPAPGGQVRAVQSDGSALVFDGDSPLRWEPASTGGALASSAGRVAVSTRTVLEFDLAPIRGGEPLLWFTDPDGGIRPVGTLLREGDPFLSHLINAGWAAVGEDGSVVWASAVKPLLRKYDPDGRLLWESSWVPSTPVTAPRLVSSDGQISPAFHVLHHAVATGPDGRTYVLAAEHPDSFQADRLLVFDPDGTLARTGTIEPGGAVFVLPTGHVFVASAEWVLTRTDGPERRAFPPFDLESLTGDGRVALDAHLGKVVVVNFWASWCGPCRREMPALDAYAATLDTSEVVVLGLNEDVSPDDGIAFLEALGGVRYTNAQGLGKLRARYNYRGLPYTVVLDPEHREVKRIYGFGSSIQPIRTAVEAATGVHDPGPGPSTLSPPTTD